MQVISLKLPISSLDRLVLVLRLQVRDLSALPAKSSQTLGEDRVGVVVAGIDRVGVHGAQVLDLELEQGLRQFLRVPEALSEVI